MKPFHSAVFFMIFHEEKCPQNTIPIFVVKSLPLKSSSPASRKRLKLPCKKRGEPNSVLSIPRKSTAVYVWLSSRVTNGFYVEDHRVRLSRLSADRATEVFRTRIIASTFIGSISRIAFSVHEPPVFIMEGERQRAALPHRCRAARFLNRSAR